MSDGASIRNSKLEKSLERVAQERCSGTGILILNQHAGSSKAAPENELVKKMIKEMVKSLSRTEFDSLQIYKHLRENIWIQIQEFLEPFNY